MANLITWNGRSELDRFRGKIDRLFDDFLSRSPLAGSLDKGDWMPDIDVSETDNEIIIHAEVPGMDAKDIDISLNGRALTIKGERSQEQEEESTCYHRLERRYGSFSRSLELPANVDADQIKATYKDGVLRLNMPKSEKQSIKQIEVHKS